MENPYGGKRFGTCGELQGTNQGPPVFASR